MEERFNRLSELEKMNQNKVADTLAVILTPKLVMVDEQSLILPGEKIDLQVSDF